jgi:hypothetical protein
MRVYVYAKGHMSYSFWFILYNVTRYNITTSEATDSYRNKKTRPASKKKSKAIPGTGLEGL